MNENFVYKLQLGHFGKIRCFLLLIVLLSSCKNNSEKISDKAVPSSAIEKSVDVDEALSSALRQLDLQTAFATEENRIPRTVNPEGEMHWTNLKFDWTEGFYPGSLWYLYKYTKDEKWKSAATSFQAMFEQHKNLTTNHDLGFVFNCSYGNGYELTQNTDFMAVMITAAESLSTRFNPNVGCIKSWDVDRGWQSERNWMFPVIIDNMMNLELLFKVSELTGDDKYKEIAITHANTTLKHHFREDNSSYHVVDYDPETGKVRNKETAQGFAHESAWARGQAWGLYGYTVCYRYTKDEKYLDQAKKIAQYIYDNRPADAIPYWDYNADKIPDEPRDVSAATIIVSALIELDSFTKESYRAQIDEILNSLASEEYTAKIGGNNDFILKHSVGSIPHGNEIDVPLNYADYYYLESLLRYGQAYEKN
ncbi:glycoside hydrolase family 88 protein [uncultured Kriegella sp.]|uniref:glycoside hydrolase family 88 protein n=1 Tax=uncultured Kriegella sp. TaxID=1798910 RepID=UPI0030D9A9CF